ncbi:MAG: AAA family ATPase [Pseudomonadota bacterium]
MASEKLSAAQIGLPRFSPGDTADGDPFSLSSHRRAREALEFGLSIRELGFNIFVVGEDHSGRMTATLDFMEKFVAGRPPAGDWLYLNNFRHWYRPKPYRVPAGVGFRFRARMEELVPRLREALTRAFGSEDYRTQIDTAGATVRAGIAERMRVVRDAARAEGLDVVETPQGLAVVAAQAGGGRPGEEAEKSQAEGEALAEKGEKVMAGLADINRWVGRQQSELAAWVRQLDHRVAEQAIGDLLDGPIAEFSVYPGLARWLAAMRVDVFENLDTFQPPPSDGPAAPAESAEARYAVNLLVDHSSDPHPPIVLEANPTYENLFGRIEYRQSRGALQTDFSLIRAGSLHRANGGILVLRAEAIAANPAVWEFLKGALRDRHIRVEELHRTGSMPIAGAPRPKPIPLDLKVVLVGAPRWYEAFFAVDPDFQTYFKVKADIDRDLDATPDNIACYAGLIRRMARVHGEAACEEGAVVRLLGIAARWAEHRDKLSSRFERIEDLVSEALELGAKTSPATVTEAAIVAALANRRRRNARAEDRMQEAIGRGVVMIDVSGAVVGQINALTVRDLGDHRFGTPARVTARASVGRRGVVNIEREAELGGPIQQKGAMVLQGFLAGHFARRLPLSFSCSITFEQSYGGVEGDSASMAEVLAILSDLSGLALRQNLAITGSVNQRGQAQAIGGIQQKVEGFYRTCLRSGGLSGTQGVVMPRINRENLALRDDLVEAVAAGRFHIWTVGDVDEAVELFTGLAAGTPDADGNYPPATVYGRVMAQLATFDRILAERERG